jgi:hypothetical protein
MNDEKNDMNREDPEKNISSPLKHHLRAMLPDGEGKTTRDPLPREFLEDASEGLQQVKDEKQLETVLQQLNRQMHLQLIHKKKSRKRRGIGDLSWAYWAIIIILIFSILGYLVIRMSLKH